MSRKNILVVGFLMVVCTSWFAFSTGEVQAATDGPVTVPILLYHDIPDQSAPNQRYSVSAARFEQQMKLLKEWGYTTISIEQLVKHLRNGHGLPTRPIVISFDDGYLNVFDNAFPIMEGYGFTGTVYIVSNRLRAEGFMNHDELRKLVESDWEVGSHGMTHTDLTQNHELVRQEVLQSRLDINDALGINVFSFAYPFGALDAYVASKVMDYGYSAAVGVGNLSQHSSGTTSSMSRREVQGDASIEDFKELLPWKGRYVQPRRKYIPL